MAENKKSFIAYSDWNGMFKALPDDVAGRLIKHIFAYVNDENPECDDYIINALFEQIKATLKRDLEKWDSQRAQRSAAGKKSAQMRAATKSNERSTVVNEKTRNPTVSVNDSASINDSVNEIDNSFSEFWDLYDKKIDKAKCEKAWKKLTAKEIEAIKTALPNYIKSTPDTQYRKNPLTWINGKCWNDEVKAPETSSLKMNMNNYLT